MRIRDRGQHEVSGHDTQLISFDEELSGDMATGVDTVRHIHANAHRVRMVRTELGAQASRASTSLIEHAATILKSDGLAKLEDLGSLDAEHVDKFLSREGSKLSHHDKEATDALHALGYLTMLTAAEDIIANNTDLAWQEEYASRIVGKEVMLWVPYIWSDWSSRDTPHRYSAPYSSGGGHFENMSITRGTAVTGTVSEISLQKNGSITLVDGINSYSQLRLGNVPPKQTDPEDLNPWNHFGWLEASELFQAQHGKPSVLLPKIKIEAV